MSERCKEQVWPAGEWHGHQCTRKAIKDGYCKTHHPDTVKVRIEKSNKRYEEKIAKSPIGQLKKAQEEIESLTQQLESARKDAELHETSTEHLRVITEHWDEFGMMNSFGEKINAAKQYVKHYIDEKDRLK